MTKTTNYKLSQWAASDRILRTDFNADNAAIDKALKANADAVSALRKANDAAHGKFGNCHIYTTSYVGTGTYGKDNPTEIHFDRKPLFFVIRGSATLLFATGNSGAISYSGGGSVIDLTWDGSTVRFLSSRGELYQMNSKDTTYHVVAFSAED